MLTLWSTFRSPLIMGGNLIRADAWTRSLLTNAEVIAVDQSSVDNKPVVTTDDLVVWTAKPQQRRGFYVAIFNVSDRPQSVHYEWKDLGLPAPSYRVRDLWEYRELGTARSVQLTLRPHASVLYSVK